MAGATRIPVLVGLFHQTHPWVARCPFSLLKNILRKELYLRKNFLLLKDRLRKFIYLFKKFRLHTNRLLVVTLLPRILQFTSTPFLQRRRRRQN